MAEVDCGPERPPEPLPTGPDADVALASLCRALGHPARVQILRLLAAKNACFAGEITDELPLAASTVSQHLKQLKEAGLIRGEVDGPRRSYCIDRGVFDRLRALLADMEV